MMMHYWFRVYIYIYIYIFSLYILLVKWFGEHGNSLQSGAGKYRPV
jgi:hypothetical protein